MCASHIKRKISAMTTFNSTLELFCTGNKGGFKVAVLVMNTQRKTLNCTTGN